jgi:hypothetical protein
VEGLQFRGHLRPWLVAGDGVVVQRRVGEERLVIRELFRRAAGPALVVRVPDRAKEPRPVLLERPAKRHIVLMDLACRRGSQIDVVGVPVEWLIGDNTRTVELVASTLADHVDHQPIAHR